MLNINNKIPFSIPPRSEFLRVYLNNNLISINNLEKEIGINKRSIYRYIKKYSYFEVGNNIIKVRDYGSLSRYKYHLKYKGCKFEKDSIKEICFITKWNIKTMAGVYGRLNNNEEVNYHGSIIKKSLRFNLRL